MTLREQEFCVGDYRVEPLAGLVKAVSDAESAPERHLQPRVMSVLICLAEHKGEVVERDTLLSEVWGRPATDEVLTRAIHELRVAFGDNTGQPGYIQTVPKIGYRLIAPVTLTSSPETGPTETPSERGPDTQTDRPIDTTSYLSRSSALWASALLLIVTALGYLLLSQEEPGPDVNYDEIVLAGFENLTDNSSLGVALDIAFRTGIEQSPWLSIIPPNSLASALQRMGAGQRSSIDRSTAIEISRREQAHAVIVGSVANVGQSYRLSAEILEPESGRTLFTHHSTVSDENQILRGLDEVIAAIRRESGEALSVIESTSTPLEKVTTANFEALEAYSVGVQKSGLADIEAAIPFFKESIRLDPQFAMAYAKLGFLQLVISDDDPEADWNLDKALEHKERLTRREQLYVEALRVRNEEPQTIKDAWSLLIHTYPKYAEGYRRLGNLYFRLDNDYPRAAATLEKAVALPDPWNTMSTYNLGFVQLAAGDYKQAIANFQTAWDSSEHPMSAGLGLAHVVMKDYPDAESFLKANDGHPARSVRRTIAGAWISYYIDQGRLAEASLMADKAALLANGDTSSMQGAMAAQCAALSVAADVDGFERCLRKVINIEANLLEEGYVKRRYWPSSNLALLGVIAARQGMYSEARSALATVGEQALISPYFFIQSYATVLEAELAIADGRHAQAIALLRPITADNGIFQAHVSLARAHEKAGDTESAIAEYTWVKDARGQAFSEHMSRRFAHEFHILDWAMAKYHLGRLYEKKGKTAQAAMHYEALMNHWQNADDNLAQVAVLQERLDGLASAASASSL